MTDVNNCGACGTVCIPGPHVSSVACNASQCKITACNTGFVDCDGNFNTGCEVNVQTNTQNCGACGLVCPTSPCAPATCTASTCGHNTAPQGTGCGTNQACDNSGNCKLASGQTCTSGTQCATGTCSGGVCT
jgi:hypothetical protein